MKYGLAVCLSFLSTGVFSAPVYLDCSVSSDTETTVFSVMADEQSGNVTHTGASGSAFNAKGFFAANSITYQNVSVADLTITYKYEIDRTTLQAVQSFSVEVTDPELRAEIPGSASAMYGKCAVVNTEGRKI